MDNKSDNATGDNLTPKFKVGDILKWGEYDSITIVNIDTNNKRYDFKNNMSKGGSGSIEIDTIDNEAILVQSSSSANEVKKVEVSPPPVSVKAIIQINENQEITVLDAIPNGKTLNTSSPYELLENRTESVFAVKITKKVKGTCTPGNDKIKCITSDNFDYELDLTTAESNIDTPLSEDFLGNVVAATATTSGAASGAASGDASGAASGDASGASSSSSASSDTKTVIPASAAASAAYTPDNVNQFLSIVSNKDNFNNYLNSSSSDKKFGENINYLKIAESVVTNKINIENSDKCEPLISEAAIYALNILDKYTSGIADNDTQYSEILTAFEILNAVDPQSTKANVNKDKINVEIKDKINTKNIITDVKAISIDSKRPSYDSIPPLTGYTPVIVDQGGSGNCFYYSVWGGLMGLGEEKYNKITGDLTTFAKTMKPDSVDFTDTFNNKENFNINIRKLLALCFLADTNNTIYTSYTNDMWNKGEDGVNTLIEAVKDLAYGLRTIIQAKCEAYKRDPTTKFFTSEEFKNILANNVSANGVFATQIEVDMIKKVFSNCNVILEVYSPNKKTGEKLPTAFDAFSYIYVRHTGGEHYQQIQTTTGKKDNCIFTQEPLNGDYQFWKYNSSSAGGSRKNRQRKSKKTKRKYYVYKK